MNCYIKPQKAGRIRIRFHAGAVMGCTVQVTILDSPDCCHRCMRFVWHSGIMAESIPLMSGCPSFNASTAW
jgi:hypothetical protein